MSDTPPPYNSLYIKAWTALSIIVALILLSMFVLGSHFLHAGNIVWSLLRWLASPLI